ncbi:MAG: FAD binding domain-containing protein [Candidatus Eisenbacteria bacterium]
MREAEYLRPRTIDEALAAAGRHPGDYAYIAGGTDLIVHLKQRLVAERVLIDLTEIGGLSGVADRGDSIAIGSMTTLAEIEGSSLVREKLPLLAEAARAVASPVIRKTATLGGNLLVRNRCSFYNQSLQWRVAIGSCLRDGGETCLVTGAETGCFARNVSDTAPALLALGAKAEIRDRTGTRRDPLSGLYAQDGMASHRGLEGDAILTGIEVPGRTAAWWYKKLRLRRSVDFSSLTVAAAARPGEGIRVSLGGVSPAPVLIDCDPSGRDEPDNLVRRARKECRTVKNDALPLDHRRDMIEVYLRKMWETIGGS